MKLCEFAQKILCEPRIEDKLTSTENIQWNESETWDSLRVDLPARDERISFSTQQVKFPGKGALQHKKERGKALHFFANHELLAIEMMAQAILLFPEISFSQRKLLVTTIAEEQKHFQLYVERMGDFETKLGDYPLNQFFWSFMDKIKTLDEFFAVISLTFEQANLDFAKYYMGVFAEIGDQKTASILDIVYSDEIKHVARGRHEMSQSMKEDKEMAQDLWRYYCSVLPDPLTPARAKGIIYDTEGRRMAGLPLEYINSLEGYRDDFSITKRKQWKK